MKNIKDLQTKNEVTKCYTLQIKVQTPKSSYNQ